MKRSTIKKLVQTSNAIRHITTTEEDGLGYLNGVGLIIVMFLWIVLLIVFGTMLGGL